MSRTPQAPQKISPPARRDPQDGQKRVTGAPQWIQNLASLVSRLPQVTHGGASPSAWSAAGSSGAGSPTAATTSVLDHEPAVAQDTRRLVLMVGLPGFDPEVGGDIAALEAFAGDMAVHQVLLEKELTTAPSTGQPAASHKPLTRIIAATVQARARRRPFIITRFAKSSQSPSQAKIPIFGGASGRPTPAR